MVTLQIENGPSFQVNWRSGLNAQQVLEAAYIAAPAGSFTYALQYFGHLGYLVNMVNETYETFTSSSAPFFYWEFLVNGVISPTGIDLTSINDGDVITFAFITYVPSAPHQSTTHAKYKLKTMLA